jgi:hypothetical protein
MEYGKVNKGYGYPNNEPSEYPWNELEEEPV